LIKASVLRLVGQLDEEYFMYWEDVDFCIRVREAGLEVWYNHDAIVYHKTRSLSRSRRSYWFYGRNVFLLTLKHATLVERAAFLLVYFGVRFPIMILSLALYKRDKPSLTAYLGGVLEGIFLVCFRGRQDFRVAVAEHGRH